MSCTYCSECSECLPAGNIWAAHIAVNVLNVYLQVNLSWRRQRVAHSVRVCAGAVSVTMLLTRVSSGTVSYAHGDLQAGRAAGRQIFCAYSVNTGNCDTDSDSANKQINNGLPLLHSREKLKTLNFGAKKKDKIFLLKCVSIACQQRIFIVYWLTTSSREFRQLKLNKTLSIFFLIWKFANSKQNNIISKSRSTKYYFYAI